ncbi:hypothetical protein BJ912DRAFT_932521 [Pholiota molesta]|nr:hypothetical protein BJ912DRAFT_932521 [Pholiota molesta]
MVSTPRLGTLECEVLSSIPGWSMFSSISQLGVTHFNCKHSIRDEYCQSNCNPAMYRELYGEGDKAWYFNSSIAEQTNVWLGTFNPIPYRYNTPMLVDGAEMNRLFANPTTTPPRQCTQPDPEEFDHHQQNIAAIILSARSIKEDSRRLQGFEYLSNLFHMALWRIRTYPSLQRQTLQSFFYDITSRDYDMHSRLCALTTCSKELCSPTQLQPHLGREAALPHPTNKEVFKSRKFVEESGGLYVYPTMADNPGVSFSSSSCEEDVKEMVKNEANGPLQGACEGKQVYRQKYFGDGLYR